jgi:hypothetical protein
MLEGLRIVSVSNAQDRGCHLGQDAIQQGEHLGVRVRPAADEDQAGTVRLLACEQAWVIESRSAGTAISPAPRTPIDELRIAGLDESNGAGVNGRMAAPSPLLEE